MRNFFFTKTKNYSSFFSDLPDNFPATGVWGFGDRPSVLIKHGGQKTSARCKP